MVIVLELGPLDDQEAHAQEDGLDPFPQQGERMPMPEQRRASRQGDVDGVANGTARRRRRETFGQRRVDVLLELIGGLSQRRAFVHRRGRDVLQERGNQAVLARQVLVAKTPQIRFTSSGRQVVSEKLFEGIDVHRFKTGEQEKRSACAPVLL